MSEMIAVTLEVLYCIIDVVLLYRLSQVFLEQKDLKPYRLVFYTLCVALVPILVPGYSSLGMLLSTLSVVLYVIVVFKDSIVLKTIVGIGFMVSVGIVSSVTTSIAVSVFHIAPEALMDDMTTRLIAVFMMKLFMAVLIEVASLLRKKKQNYTFLDSPGVLALLVLAFVTLMLIFEYIFIREQHLEGQFIDTIVIVFAVLFTFVFYMFYRFYQNKNKVLNYEYQIKEAELKEQNYIQELEHNMLILQTKHDLKNHFSALRYYIESQDQKKALEYLDSVEKQNGFKVYVHSNNEIVNAILNVKISEFEDIKFNVRYQFEMFQYPPRFLTVILGNALDNAIEAVRKMPHEDRVIDVTLTENDAYSKIVISNKFRGEVQSTQGRYRSSKGTNRKGIGIESIKRVVNENGGRLSIDHENNLFRMVILLKKEQDLHSK